MILRCRSEYRFSRFIQIDVIYFVDPEFCESVTFVFEQNCVIFANGIIKLFAKMKQYRNCPGSIIRKTVPLYNRQVIDFFINPVRGLGTPVAIFSTSSAVSKSTFIEKYLFLSLSSRSLSLLLSTCCVRVPPCGSESIYIYSDPLMIKEFSRQF